MSIFPEKVMNKLIIFFLIFYVAGFLFFSFKITDVPPGINGDEAVIGYNAALIAKTGHDSSGKVLPLFSKMMDSSDWKQPVTLYSTIIGFKLFGISFFNLRMVSVVFVLLGGTIIFFLAEELFDLKIAVISLLIFVTTPIVMIQSHLAMENIAPVPFVAFWLLMLVKYEKEFQAKYLILAGLSLGLALYSYLGMRLIVPVLAAGTLLYIFFLNFTRKTRKLKSHLLFFVLIIIPFFMALFLVKSKYQGAVLGLYHPYTISTYQQLLLPFISSFDPSFLYFSGDTTPYHSTGRHGVLLLATLPLFLAGLIGVIRKGTSMLIFISVVFFSIPVLYGLASDIHRGSRLLALLPLYSVITSAGFITLFKLRNKLVKISLVSLFILLILLNYADFLRDYWYEYPKRVKSEFAKPYHFLFDRAYQLSKKKNSQVFIQHDFRAINSTAIDFFEIIYFPNKLKLWQEGQPLPDNGILIASEGNLSIINVGKKEIFGENGFGLVINQ